MKKIISMFMAVALVMTAMTVPASAVDVCYYEDGMSKLKTFDTQEEADQWSLEHLGIDWAAIREQNEAILNGTFDAETAKPVTTQPVDTASDVTETANPVETVSPTPVPVANDNAFTDVPADAWYAEAVNALAEGGLIKGVGNGKFNPLGTVTYAEFVTVLSRLFGLPETVASNTGLLTSGPYGSRIVHGNLDTRERPTHWAWPMLANFISQAIRDPSGSMMVGIAPEDIDYDVLRAHAIALITMAYERSGQSMTPVNNLTEADIPDWSLVEGIYLGSNAFLGYGEYGMPIYGDRPIYVVGDRLNFWPDVYVTDNETGNLGYNQSEIDRIAKQVIDIGHPEAAYKPIVNAYPDKVLLAYNLGLAQGIDANRTCGALNTLTRAELCQLLYNAGLTHDGMCKPDRSSINYLL